ncbi:tryptophan--tRNA ligase [Pseudomonas taiwanensis]|uniref:tryptophan--tRNA ligase n=1 Tax=Pseudomonas taiwanensis TaxID=470150 RepID=UPI0028DD86E6|nr:tryptophan--tRNA ligase [Pseudomonas taiwanensis]MDT8924744.1 tryptophan--tRNA ligase [Pseudomonas taiwanensis]
MKTRILTGITTTGTPHLGNYAGAIMPAIEASQGVAAESFFFLADYHALIKCDDASRIEQSRMEVAATWLAAGLDPERVTFYRQSDIPEITELTWLLTCVSAKGFLNRSHAYKAAVDKNTGAGQDADAGISMGLFSYPVLMAADILLFNAHKVPVGRDQIQHVEMAKDIGQRFNNAYGNGVPVFVLPEAVVDERVATLPGLDGRKMSKSYDNTIPLFTSSRLLKEAIGQIVTDSLLPGEPKDPDSSALYSLYQAFSTPAQALAYRADLLQGLGWGEAKKRLYELLNSQIEPMREHYSRLLANPSDLEDILQHGAHKARSVARPLMAQLRDAVGLRSFNAFVPKAQEAVRKVASEPEFVSYREDGAFYFKLVGDKGSALLVSTPFATGKEMGAALARVKAGQQIVLQQESNCPVVYCAGELVAQGEPFLDEAQAQQVMDTLGKSLGGKQTLLESDNGCGL